MTKRQSFYLQVIVAVLFLFAWAEAQDIPPTRKPELSGDRVRQAIFEYMHRLEGFGFSGQVLVLEKGKVLLNEGYGAARRDPLIAIDRNTVFDIASLTKHFTAAGILHLETEGKLKTSDSISKYLDGVPADKAQITIMQLITHMSGIRRDGISNDSKDILTRDETVRAILQSELRSKPGEQYGYSNAGYNLLAAIIEKTSGRKFFDYLNEALFQPAGMGSTFSETDYQRKRGRFALHHNEWRQFSERNERAESWHFFGPSGISTSAGDLSKWEQALRGTKVFPKEALTKLLARQQPLEPGVFYGFGWFLQKSENGSDLISSGGDMAGSHSEFRWWVQNERLIIVLTNQDVFGLSGGAVQKRIIADNLGSILDGEAVKDPPQVAGMRTDSLRRYEGIYALPTGERYKVWLDGKTLKIGAEGQTAIDLLLYSETDAANPHDEANKRSALIFDAISKNETDKLKSVFSAEEFGTFIPALKNVVDSQTASGPLRRAFIRGTIPFPYNKNSSRTYVQLQFEKEVIDLFVGWNGGKINDVTSGEGKPFPLILPIAPQSETNFATFDLFSSKSVPIVFSLDKNRNASSFAAGSERSMIAYRLDK